MFTNRKTALLAIVALVSSVLIAGTGGAIAGGLIGTNQIKDSAVTSPKIKDKTIKTTDLAPAARGAQVVQYRADGAIFDTADSTVVTLPGTWNEAKLGKGTWSVQLLRGGSEPILFSLGQSANAGEGTGDGFYLLVSGGTATVRVNAPSYSVIDHILITQTRTTQVKSATLSARARSGPVTGG